MQREEQMVRFKVTGPYVTPPRKLSSFDGLEALRRKADEEYERSGNVFMHIYSEGKPRSFTGFAIAVIKGRTPPPHICDQVAVRDKTEIEIEGEGGNDDKTEIETEGELTHGRDETSEHSAWIC